MPGHLRRVAAVLVTSALLITVAGMAFTARGFDFRAFYCAGMAAREGHNPYRTQPLHACEVGRTDASFNDFARRTTLPAPMPGYAIAAVEPLSALPFGTALKIWSALLALAVTLSALALRRLTNLSFPAILCSLFLCEAFASIGLGEVMPFVFLAMVLCALALRARAWMAAAAAAACTLIEPHVGIPVVAALAVWAPRSRVSLGIALAALAALSLAALGPAANLEYVMRVLPYHALAEVGADSQLSITAVLHAFHANDAVSIAAGGAWYAAMVVAGLLLARLLSLRFADDAFLALVPPAVAVIGGTFVHVTQAAAAVPLTLLLLACAPAYRKSAVAALLLLTVPWVWLGTTQFPLLGYVLIPYMAWELLPADPAFGSAFAAAALALVLLLRPTAPLPTRAVTAASAGIPAQFAQAEWAAEVRRSLSGNAPQSWARRVPTWFGLLLVTGAAAIAARRKPADAYTA